MNSKISSKCISLWILGALIAPTLTIAAGIQWIDVLPMAAVFGAISIAILSGVQNAVRFGKWLSILECIWLGVVCGIFAQMAQSGWADGDVQFVIPLVLLLLAAFASQNGSLRAARQSGTILWIVGVTGIIVLCAGLGEIKWELPQPEKQPVWEMGMVFLLPCATVFMPTESKKKLWITVIVCLLLAVAVAVIVSGSTKEAIQPFYEYSKSIQILGAARRFEALVSCAMTAGWFSLLTVLLCGAGELSKGIRGRNSGVWLTALAAALTVLCNLTIPWSWMVFLTLLFWGVIPLGIQFLGRK